MNKRAQRTHNEGTSRAEGKGPTGIEVGGVERDQDTNEVETLCLGEAEKPSCLASHPKLLGLGCGGGDRWGSGVEGGDGREWGGGSGWVGVGSGLTSCSPMCRGHGHFTHLTALLLKGTVILFSLTSWPGYLKWRVKRSR